MYSPVVPNSPHEQLDSRRIHEVLRAIEARIEELAAAREALVAYHAEPSDAALSRFNARLATAYDLPSFVQGNLVTFQHVSPLVGSSSLTHRDLLIALNAAIEHLQRTEPAEGSAIAGIIGELEELAGRVIANETCLKLDPIKAQLDEAVARAEELLATRRVTS